MREGERQRIEPQLGFPGTRPPGATTAGMQCHHADAAGDAKQVGLPGHEEVHPVGDVLALADSVRRCVDAKLALTQ